MVEIVKEISLVWEDFVTKQISLTAALKDKYVCALEGIMGRFLDEFILL